MTSMMNRWLSLCCLFAVGNVHAYGADVTLTHFLRDHCIRCHGRDLQEADRRFDAISDEPTELAQLELINDALGQINLGAMPPEDEPQPSDAARISVAAAMQAALDEATKKLGGDSGKTVLRRLNRYEYDRSVRQLLSLDPLLIEPTGDFPPDEKRENFRNDGESLVLSDFLLSRYLEASAEYLRVAAAPVRQPKVQTWSFGAPFYRTGNRHDGKDVPGEYQHIRKNYHDEGGFLWIEEFAQGVPTNGHYKVRVKADGIDRNYPYEERRLKLPERGSHSHADRCRKRRCWRS